MLLLQNRLCHTGPRRKPEVSDKAMCAAEGRRRVCKAGVCFGFVRSCIIKRIRRCKPSAAAALTWELSVCAEMGARGWVKVQENTSEGQRMQVRPHRYLNVV